jgi:hypothetical protein
MALPTAKVETRAGLPLTAPNILIMGPPGTGKSTSIETLLRMGIECFVIATEANAIDAILDRCAAMHTPTDKLHWCHVKPIQPSWRSLGEMVAHITTSSYEQLSKISGIEKAHTNQVALIVHALQDFKCEHCKKSFGDVATWGYDRALILDSTTGLNRLCRSGTVGFKPTMHEGEWGVAMGLEEMFITSLCNTTNCYFVLIGHVDREIDAITGGTKIMIGLLGKKLAPKIPADFREVVLSIKEGKNYYWSNMSRDVDTKKGILPDSDKLEPSFKPIVEAFQKRLRESGGDAAAPSAETKAA